MKKNEVQVGQTYIVKVSGKETKVRLVRESPYGGWDGTNLATGRSVRIKTAAKLRRLATAPRGASSPSPKATQPRFKSCAEHPESKGSTRCDECGAKLRALNERMTAAVFGTPAVDLRVRDEGTVVQFIPETEAAAAWAEENLADAPRLGNTFVVEHRFAGDVVNGAREAGLRVAS